MKKFFIIAAILLAATTAMAQTQPDAEYNLIRRTYKVNKDGSMDIRFRKEIKLLRNRAITAYADKGETFITYNPAFESLKINECYTLRADGSKVMTPDNAFVLQLPSECTDCGRYSGIREMAIVHTALEYNCTVVLDYTIHRNSSKLVERFNLSQDCPVKRYEIRFADGHTQIETNLPQTINDRYMPAKNGFDVEFELGDKPVFVAEKSLPDAAHLLKALRKDDAKAYATAIRDWVVDDVHLNTVDLARTDYAMTPAAEVFASNCGTTIDKTGLLAALLNEAGFKAEIADSSLNVFGDVPLMVAVTIEGTQYFCTAIDKQPLVTQEERMAATKPAEPIYVDRQLEWNPDTITENYVRITLPNEKGGLNINPAFLAPSRTSEVQAGNVSEFYHYTMTLPKGAKLMGGNVEVAYTLTVGSISIIIKQKGNKLIITRSLRLNKPVVTRNDYASFRKIMTDWNDYKELLFTVK